MRENKEFHRSTVTEAVFAFEKNKNNLNTHLGLSGKLKQGKEGSCRIQWLRIKTLEPDCPVRISHFPLIGSVITGKLLKPFVP